jgi:D-alanyl-D-alanine carboxypeptidase
MRFATGAILLFLSSASSFVHAQEPARSSEPVKAASFSSTTAIDDYVQERMHKRHIPGVSIGIVQNGKVIQAKGFGVANVELSVPATENTVYQLASVTKTFTAAAIIMLVQEGKLGLDDKVTARLHDLPPTWAGVTVRHLLNHTSGIKSYTSVRDFSKTMRKDYTQREIVNLVAKEPPEFAPGEKWSYNNTGYFLLGMLIEKITGKKYGEFLDERIFKPLSMTQSRVNDLHAVIPNRAQGYTWDGKELRNGEYVSPTQPFSAGMLVSTVDDLLKWDAALLTESLLKKSTLEQMWTPTRLSKGGESDYGFGWSVGKENGHRIVGHGGGIPGFSTQLSRYVDDNLTVIVLTNSDNGNAGALARGIAARLVPALAEEAEKPIADSDTQTTERLKGVILAALKGEADAELFTKDSKERIVAAIKQGKGTAASVGALKEFLLHDRTPSDQGVKLRYRAKFANEAMNAFFDLDKDGKIAGMRLQSVD